MSISFFTFLSMPTRNTLSKPLRGRGFFIEGSGANEGFLLGYSLEGDLDRALEHPLFLALLDAYDNQVVPPSYSVLPAGLKSSVEPLLTDHWNQPEPYNICAPMVEGKHCVVGCVALAMSQVMRYWQWPKAGTGMHSYLDSLGCGETLSADFAHEYKWDLMRDVYEGPVDSSDVGLLEAGRLMRDCGVAVEMQTERPIRLINIKIVYFNFNSRNFIPRKRSI